MSMTSKIATALFALSVLFSGWLYWGSDFKIEKRLTSSEWQSNSVTLIKYDLPTQAVATLREVHVESNVRYLPNGEYIRLARITLFAEDSATESIIDISEKGHWDVSDNYLLVSPSEFKDMSTPLSKDFTRPQISLITQVFKMDAEQSRRIDIVNEKALLLTSLSQGSTVLFRH